MSKVIRGFLFLSIILFLGVFFFVYANLPKQVMVIPEQINIEKDTFFYLMIALFVLFNFLFTVTGLLFKNIKPASLSLKKQEVRTWFVSLPVMINFYIIFSTAYIGVLNNPSNFNTGSYNYLNYLGPILLFGWIIALFFIVLKKDQTSSESVN